MKKRKLFKAQTKISILKQHLLKKEDISTLSKQHDCTPRTIYQWQEILFTKGHELFEDTRKAGRPINDGIYKQRCLDLEEKLRNKNEVISQIMEELLKEKKLGGVI